MVIVFISINSKQIDVFGNGECNVRKTISQYSISHFVYIISCLAISFIYIMVVMSVALAFAGTDNDHSGHTGHFGHSGHIGHIGHTGNLPVAINQFVIMNKR